MAGAKYSKEQKERFLDLIDRGGTVRAAAKAVGVHEAAAYTWLRSAGLSMQRATPRKYSEKDKAEFFRRLGDNPNVSAVAREMGFTRVTCYAWAHKAGIRTSEARKVNPRREEFLRLRAEGMTRGEARARVGADARSATDWDKGITIINRGRIYPDGRVVRYPESTLAGVTPERRIRYCPTDGHIDITAAVQAAHPTQRAEATWLRMTVSNTGPAIPSVLAPHIFDAWVSSRDGSEAGGLGLWIARETAHDCGGDIALDQSVPGQTTFVVDSPMQTAAPRDEAQDSDPFPARLSDPPATHRRRRRRRRAY